MSLGVEKLLPSDCLNINEFPVIHINTHSDASARNINSLSNLLVSLPLSALKRRLISILTVWDTSYIYKTRNSSVSSV